MLQHIAATRNANPKLIRPDLCFRSNNDPDDALDISMQMHNNIEFTNGPQRAFTHNNFTLADVMAEV